MYTLTPFERRSMDLFDAFHDLENSLLGSRVPAAFGSFKTDIRDDGDSYTLEAELPGFDKDEINHDITGDTLRLSAVHKEEKDEKDKDKYVYRERTYGSYQRSFDISAIDADKIGAEYKNGILYLDLPKKEARKPETKRLEIKG